MVGIPSPLPERADHPGHRNRSAPPMDPTLASALQHEHKPAIGHRLSAKVNRVSPKSGLNGRDNWARSNSERNPRGM